MSKERLAELVVAFFWPFTVLTSAVPAEITDFAELATSKVMLDKENERKGNADGANGHVSDSKECVLTTHPRDL